MGWLDWIIILFYLSGMIGLSVYLGRNQTSQEDYFVGGRKLPWWAIGISTMATQTSAISFISLPAFVALKSGGGLSWLQMELALPLAIIIVMVFLLPFFRRLELVSVYEYLEHRFSPTVRYLVSFIFLLSRGLAAGVAVYASGIVLSVCLDIPLWVTILTVGIVTIIYDTIGGITAVVYSDVIQMVILLGGIILCIFYAADIVGGLGAMWSSFPEARRVALDPSSGFNNESAAPFWPFLIGGFFLYISYYGTDQSQVQRELSAASSADTKKSLLLNGLARFPLTLLYVVLGIAMLAVYRVSPDLAAHVPADRPDYLVPQFVLLYIPAGVRALIFASLLAAAMSSLDSALNSLSASTMRDFIGRKWSDPSRLLLASKLTTVAWGILITAFAFLAGRISDTVIEAVNKVGSAFYGPILATFLVGVLSRRVTAFGILAGLPLGVALNLYLWLAFPAIHWMWWNCFGFLTTAAVALLSSRWFSSSLPDDFESYVLEREEILEDNRGWGWAYLLLAVYFVLMLLLLYAVSE